MRFSSFVLAAFSMGSALAAPATHQQNARALEVLTTATSTLASVKTNVEGELQSISKLVLNVNANTTTLVPQLEQSLLGVVGEVTKVVGTILPLVKDGVPALAEDQLSAVPTVLNGVLSLANGIKSTSQQVVDKAHPDVVKAVQPELQLVLSTVQPIVKPIITLALGVVGEVTGPVVGEVQGLVGDIENVAGGILSPITKLVGGLL
ncbi:hypothetical protein GGR52DRAFT_45119 [Hypoxylon sp. FL1284]|nr:hypothetical protein GGR52DRAFT_45119 [Hypoxylon sp. FL1284]